MIVRMMMRMMIQTWIMFGTGHAVLLLASWADYNIRARACSTRTRDGEVKLFENYGASIVPAASNAR